ncbi:MAG: winged helix-turn-helix domain-containing protein [Proteobacteria bacterium]|nr:winged helix-turn-helix domain-containing protein [Pseudomonadota bacterium]
MRKPAPLPAGSKESLEQLLKKVKTKTQFQKVQCLWLRASLGLSSDDVAIAIGWNASSVRHLQALFLKEGEAVLQASKRGGRYRANITADEENTFLASFLEKSVRGEILVVSKIKSAYEKIVGHAVPKSTIYRILARHGWRKITPRPHHPKADVILQEEFKKNSPK